MAPIGPEDSRRCVGGEPQNDQERQGYPEQVRLFRRRGEIKSQLVREPVAGHNEDQVQCRVAPVDRLSHQPLASERPRPRHGSRHPGHAGAHRENLWVMSSTALITSLTSASVSIG